MLKCAQIAPYFSKVECFCFEEQKLLAGEEVDMPLLFFIDKDVLDDPQCRDLDDVVLSYTFFKYACFFIFSNPSTNLRTERGGQSGETLCQTRTRKWC